MKVNFTEFSSRTFELFNTNYKDFSQVLLTFKKVVFEFDEILTFELESLTQDSVYMVLQDKTKVYLEDEIIFDEKKEIVEIDLSQINLPNAGVYTV